MASNLSEEVQRKKKKMQKNLKLIEALGNELTSSREHINNLPTLLSYVSDSPPELAVKSIIFLHPFFITVIADLPKPKRKAESKSDPEFIYATWLRAKFDEFVGCLVQILVSSQADEKLVETVLESLMEFVKLGSDGKLNSAIYHKLIHNIVHCQAANEFLLDLLVSKYFKYIDVRYFTYISLDKISRTLEEKHSSEGTVENGREQLIHNTHSILSRIPAQDGAADTAELLTDCSLLGECETVSAKKKGEKKTKTEKPNSKMLSAPVIVKRMKLKFTKAWTSFLKLSLPLNVYKEVLVNLHQTVIPYHSNPAILSDFLTRSYDIGGVISVMALSSLFLLMTQHGLEYPNFYDKLYALLVPSIFMAKHRAKFFQLLDSCLKSSLLPAYLAAAFAKRLSRLSVSVPPSGSLVIVVLIHNLLRRHPSINCLVHRENDENAEGDSEDKKDSDSVDGSVKMLGIDRFNDEESDPKKSHAMSSSLWEIDTLRHHYCPPVSRFVLSLENDLTVRSKTTEISIEDFSSGSYATIFGDEIRRRVKQVPLAFYKTTPTSLFSESEFSGWTFKMEYKNETAEPTKRQRIQ